MTAVLIQLQADMWDAEKGAVHQAAYEPYVQSIASHTTAFAKPVLLVNGDSHVYLSDNPLGAGGSCTRNVWSALPIRADAAALGDGVGDGDGLESPTEPGDRLPDPETRAGSGWSVATGVGAGVEVAAGVGVVVGVGVAIGTWTGATGGRTGGRGAGFAVGFGVAFAVGLGVGLGVGAGVDPHFCEKRTV